jgi:hypothetical protein
MKVKQLINELKKLDPDLEVLITDDDFDIADQISHLDVRKIHDGNKQRLVVVILIKDNAYEYIEIVSEDEGGW